EVLRRGTEHLPVRGEREVDVVAEAVDGLVLPVRALAAAMQAEVLEPQRAVEKVRGYAVPAGGLPLRLPHGQLERVQALLDPAGHHLQQSLTLQRELLTGLPRDREIGRAAWRET